jgi:hypothetical protein
MQGKYVSYDEIDGLVKKGFTYFIVNFTIELYAEKDEDDKWNVSSCGVNVKIDEDETEEISEEAMQDIEKYIDENTHVKYKRGPQCNFSGDYLYFDDADYDFEDDDEQSATFYGHVYYVIPPLMDDV